MLLGDRDLSESAWIVNQPGPTPSDECQLSIDPLK